MRLLIGCHFVGYGLQYSQGVGVAQNKKRGIEMVADAGDRGNVACMGQMAYWYGEDGDAGGDEKKRFLPKDAAKRHEWNLKAANAGDANAMALVSSNYLNGDGVAANLGEAVRFGEAAGAKKNVVALVNLAQAFTGGVKGVPANRDKAIAYLKQAGALGFPLVDINLSNIYGGIDGLPPDHVKAFEIRKVLADKGDADAQTYIGVWYFLGQGVAKDTAKAFDYLSRAAKGGSTRGMYELGCLYYDGDVVAKDIMKALSLWRQAAVQGSPEALFRMGMRTMNGNELQQDQIEGERLLRLSADNGNADAPYVLYQIYDNGYGPEIDKKEALRWLKLGAERGDTEAIAKLKTIH